MKIPEYGAIAQLGERLPCTQEVSGSIPLSSTTSLLIEEVSHLLSGLSELITIARLLDPTRQNTTDWFLRQMLFNKMECKVKNC
jgi:hypothetical protein